MQPTHEVHVQYYNTKFTLDVPESWKISLNRDRLIAIHPDHKPRIISVFEAEYTPLKDWPTLP